MKKPLLLACTNLFLQSLSIAQSRCFYGEICLPTVDFLLEQKQRTEVSSEGLHFQHTGTFKDPLMEK